MSLISKFLELSKLDKFIASSESSQRKLNIQLEEAIVECNKALEIKEIFPEAWVNIAVSYIGLKKYQLALDYCEKALAVSENFVEALNSKGLCLFNLKRYDEANKIFDKTLKIKKNFLEAMENKANTLHALKEYDQLFL